MRLLVLTSVVLPLCLDCNPSCAATLPPTRSPALQSSRGMTVDSNLTASVSAGNRSSRQSTGDKAQVASCRSLAANDTVITIQASTKAKETLVRILQGHSAQVVFFYFNLVVGNTSFHPGSCPSDGKSTINAETPLAWVFVRETVPGAIFNRHSFARAYLTFPVSYPRIYSLGILDGNYVEDLNHAVYGMEAIVGIDEVCWEQLHLRERRAQIFDAVRKFYEELLNITGSGSSWNTCFSNPVIDDLPKAIPDPFNMEKPMYYCEDKHGQIRKLEKNHLTEAVFVFSFVLIIILAISQMYWVVTFMIAALTWGIEEDNHLEERSDHQSGNKYLKLRDRFFSDLHLPTKVSIGGIICAEEFIGQRAAWRMKCLIILAIFSTLYLVFPIYMEVCVLTPQQQASSDDTCCYVQYADTFGECGPPGDVLWLTIIVPIIPLVFVFSCCIFMGAFTDASHRNAALRVAKEVLWLPIRLLAEIFMIPFYIIRPVMDWPLAPCHTEDHRSWYFICLYPFSFIVFLIIGVIISAVVAVAAVLDLILSIVFTMIFCGIAVSEIFTKKTVFEDKILKPPVTDSAEYQSESTDKTWRYCVKIGIPSFLSISMIGCFILTFFFATCKLFMLTLLTFLALWLSSSLRTIFVITWVVAAIGELRKISADYYGPLQTVWKIHITVVRKIILKGKKTKVIPRRGDVLSVDLMQNTSDHLRNTSDDTPDDLRNTSDDTLDDLRNTLARADNAFYATCLDLLKEECPRKAMFLDFEKEQRQEITFSEGHEDSHLGLAVLTWLTRKITTREEIELKQLQHLLRERLFIQVVKTTAILIALSIILVLLFDFNTLWDTTASKDASTIVLQLLILPLFTYYRLNYLTPTIGDLDKEYLQTVIEKRMKRTEDAGMAPDTESLQRTSENPTRWQRFCEEYCPCPTWRHNKQKWSKMRWDGPQGLHLTQTEISPRTGTPQQHSNNGSSDEGEQQNLIN